VPSRPRIPRGASRPFRILHGPGLRSCVVTAFAASVLLAQTQTGVAQVPPDESGTGPPALPSPVPVPGLGADRSVGGLARFAAGATSLGGQAVGMARLGVYLELTPRYRVGSEGTLGMGGVRTSPDDAPDRSEVHLGYGGIRFEARPWSGSFTVGLLAGAGVARVESPLLGANLDTRNFFLLEPSLRWEPATGWRIRPGAGVSGRIPIGNPTLVGVGTRDLAGITLELSLQVARAPGSSP
jgi:hypothetical protein